MQCPRRVWSDLRDGAVKKFLRSPWVWIVVAAVGVLLALQYLVPNGGYKEVNTSTMVKEIDDGSVKEITFKDGGNQQILATLDNGDKVIATWVDRPAALAGRQVAGAGRQGHDREVQRRRTPSRASSARSWRRCCRSC